MMRTDERKVLTLPPGITIRQVLRAHQGTWNQWTTGRGFLGLDWSPDGRFLATTLEEAILLWDSDSGQLAASFGSHSQPVRALAWSPDGATLATLSGDALTLWDVARQQLSISFPAEPIGKKVRIRKKDPIGKKVHIGNRAEHLAWSPDGSKIAIGGTDPRILELGPEPAVCMMQKPASQTDQIAWSLDGTFIAGCGSGAVQIWRPDGAVFHMLPRRDCSALTWSRDSRFLLLSGMPALSTWNVRSKLADVARPKLSGTMQYLSCSADGQLLAVRTYSQLTLFSYGDWRKLATLDMYYAKHGITPFSPAGYTLATLHGENRRDHDLLIHIFDIDLDLLTSGQGEPTQILSG